MNSDNLIDAAQKNAFQNLELFDVPPQCVISTQISNRPFIGYKIRNQYDVIRHSIPSEYEPVYIKDNNDQIYYGVWGVFNEDGNNLLNSLLYSIRVDANDVIKILKEWNVNTECSSAHITDKIAALDFQHNQNLLRGNYHNLDVKAYINNVDVPGYIKVSGMYIFIFLT